MRQAEVRRRIVPRKQHAVARAVAAVSKSHAMRGGCCTRRSTCACTQPRLTTTTACVDNHRSCRARKPLPLQADFAAVFERIVGPVEWCTSPAAGAVTCRVKHLWMQPTGERQQDGCLGRRVNRRVRAGGWQGACRMMGAWFDQKTAPSAHEMRSRLVFGCIHSKGVFAGHPELDTRRRVPLEADQHCDTAPDGRYDTLTGHPNGAYRGWALRSTTGFGRPKTSRSLSICFPDRVSLTIPYLYQIERAINASGIHINAVSLSAQPNALQ